MPYLAIYSNTWIGLLGSEISSCSPNHRPRAQLKLVAQDARKEKAILIADVDCSGDPSGALGTFIPLNAVSKTDLLDHVGCVKMVELVVKMMSSILRDRFRS